MTTIRFPLRLGPRQRWLLLPWGVLPGNAWVRLEDDQLVARFGFFSLRTPIANIVRWEISGPFRWFSALGVRRSIRDARVTFGSSDHGGVRLDFREPVRFARLLKPPALYVTVDDLEGFAAELERRGIPGTDARR
ncbi:MAG: hypothetical protein M3432_02340 [Chloroflexota bacterium]|nr:hypothetical protein [Chloroflexota bacterium]